MMGSEKPLIPRYMAFSENGKRSGTSACGSIVAGGELREKEKKMENKTYENLKICQSCGMPMQEEQYGTNKDGSRNETYCCYCFKDGEFAQNGTMEEMVEFCAPFEVEGGRAKTIEEAKAMLMEYFPTLERWKAKAQGTV